MAEEFRNCFVGDQGYNDLKVLMKNGNDFCKDLAKCLQDRSDAEIVYARALGKHSDTLQKLSGRIKGSLAQALTTLSSQTSKEGDAHSVIAGVLVNDVSIPMRNLADTQSKDRKGIEETLNKKFKEWNVEKDSDTKYRARQFEKSKEIETLNLSISEMSKTGKSSGKDSGKESFLSTPLVMGCVKPGGRHTSNSRKSTSTPDVKHQAYMETSLNKAEEELKKIEIRYHTSTRNVEIARQACDAEMCRSCDQMQRMELDRITDVGNLIRMFANAMQTLSETMHQVSQDLYTIQIIPQNDIITAARSSLRVPETEILLYDIYAENRDNAMSEQRRILSLMQWMEVLRRDIEIQKQMNITSLSSSSARSHKTVENESPDDDRDVSSDGAMCSASSHSKTDCVVNTVVDQHQDGSSSSSNDDDGGMYRGKDKKREKKKPEGMTQFSSERFIDRHGGQLLQSLYEASLYKIETVYNRMKKLSEPRYEYEQCLARTFTDKGYQTTFLRVPFQPSTCTPPSAPPATRYFVEAMPMFAPATMQQQPVVYGVQGHAPTIGWVVDNVQGEHTVPAHNVVYRRARGPSNGVPHNQRVPSAPPNPVQMSRSADISQSNRVKHVRAIYPYKAKHDDELTFEIDDNIMLLETRRDNWCRGNLNGRIGLFPRNYVEDA